MSSLKGRDRSSPSWVVVSVFRARSGRVWTRVTGVGVQAERPQRSEDVRSGRRRGWRDTDRSRGDSGYRGMWLSGSVFMCRRSEAGPGVRLPVIPSG
jgi:hypothetical protein